MSRTVAAIEDAFGRAIQHAREQGWPGDVASLRQASDTISTLTAQLAAAEAKMTVAAEALAPFAEASRVFSFAVAPDGMDDCLTVVAAPVCRPEYEASLCTSDFSRAIAAIRALADQHKPSPAEEPMP